jgi:hypothetical protein
MNIDSIGAFVQAEPLLSLGMVAIVLLVVFAVCR